ncbi:AraC family transcriptional regulator [Vibrio sp. S4M6]|uniref:AraC family transcriptional regulator n=1 Tax=Vibrio sinus TaxID=2946865 RepID=UPI00202A3599|nr:AraC family transcriptional regulator [Vibrio sinus]MCL9779895.1 AraC family transcriptional regulator [Vibrio sinus]
MERIFHSIDYIEKNMYRPIDVHSIARASHYSTYHFSRIFRALVGDSPKEYLRKRRLTLAADRLLKTTDPILDIALDCQFESHEAFTRAFKKLFGLVPDKYRSNGDSTKLIYRDQFNVDMLNHLKHSLTMDPQIVVRPETKVVGVVSRYTEDDLDLNTLWSAFRPYLGKVQGRIGDEAFGIYEEYTESEESVGFTYICSVAVNDSAPVPKGMVSRTIPANKYAVFTHQANASLLPETLKYIWGSWLPKSRYEYAESPDFELYIPKLVDGDVQRSLSIHIPIKDK